MEQQKKLSSYTPVLIFILVIAAFAIGILWTKVSYLEKGGSAQLGETAPTSAPPKTQQPSGKIKPVTDKDHIRGNKNANLSLVEYSDLECPFCKSFHSTMQEVLKTYGDRIRWVYRHFPLSFHANAQKEAEASECVAELGGNDKFWKYVDAIFERTTSNGTGFALDKLGPLAQEVGVNQVEFQKCLDSGKYTKLVQEQIADGTSGGVTGTPSTFIIDAKGNSQIIVGAQPIEALKSAIDQTLVK